MTNSPRLSQEEHIVLSNTSFLLTKQEIDKKISITLLKYQHELAELIANYSTILPPTINVLPKKINKGQNYRGLPYWVVDFPSHFDKENIFTFRIVLWWGNYISASLIMCGNYFERATLDFVRVNNSGLSYSINSSPWPIEFEPNNLIPVETKNLIEIKRHYENSKFIKLAVKYDLKQIEDLVILCNKDFLSMLSMFNWRNI